MPGAAGHASRYRPTMQSRILNPRDLEFLLYEWLDVERLCTLDRFSEHSRETFDAALETSRRIAEDFFYPINPQLDAEEPRFEGGRVHTPPALGAALRAFAEAGLTAAGHDFALGGMQLPCTVEKACFAWFKGASVAAAGYPMLTIANANLLLAHGSPEQVERYVRPMLAGRFFGTMCLSEPQAGSSLSDIRTRAEPQPDGSYRLFGNKMWISGGEHELSENIVHLVLAKIPDADGRLVPGTRGISLFVVPKFLLGPDGTPGERNDIALAGLNHKMGYRGTTNCLLNFGEGSHRPGGCAGAIGELVGDPGHGLAAMFHMMNEARIGVGLGAVTLGYSGYLHALDYARNRPQGRHPHAKDPASPQVPIIEHADVRRMLLAQKAYAEGGLALVLYCARLVDENRAGKRPEVRERAHLLLDLLTPIAKSWPSQWCLEGNSLAIQVHGGYGYTRDYRVEQLYRDNRLNPIHEGTHGIQGLDLLGRKMRMHDGAAARAFAEEARETFGRAIAHGGELGDWGLALEQSIERVAEVTAVLYGAPDTNLMLANASAYLEAFGHVVLAWIWLEQALVAHARLEADAGADEAFYRGKLQAARYFFRWELPRIGPALALLESLDSTTLNMNEDWF